ncbi:RNA-dependent RNA polymerase [Hubei diptera virus 3]|uniref:RNA-directed RNA polymerase L n=1 Tax=Hubei diptera virus 3 TaxID=1922884 RepID=A0A1L3KPM2_9VIRU|nr:RNA-dependent RNA polymerase [Hubei diptera virus 3]APG79285.1 RNA-dependent RNA polymerase [Hubei diptera virus 3]
METLETILENTETYGDYVNSPDPIISTYIAGDLLPEFDLSLDKATDTLQINFRLIEGTSYSTIREKFIVSNHTYKAKSFVHDFTFHPLSETTDTPLVRFFPTAPEAYRSLTPDACVVINDRLFIIEYATTQSSNPRALREAYNAKRLKYLKPILDCFECMPPHERMQMGFTSVGFHIIVIGRGQIYSNLQMDDMTKNELGLRFELSLKVMEKERIMCIFPDQLGDLSENEAKLMGFLNSVEIGNGKPDDDVFSKKNYQKMIAPKDPKEVRVLIKKAFRKSAEKAIRSSEYCLQANHEKRIRESEDHKAAYYESFRKDQEFSEHQKTVVNMPFFICKNTVPSLRVKDHLKSYEMGESCEHTFRAWKEAISSYETSCYEEEEDILIPDDITEENILSQLRSLEEGEIDKEKTKNLYHRTRLNLSNDIWVKLAMQGVNGKSFEDVKEVKEKAAQRKKAFSLNIDCSDIEGFLDGCLSDLFWEYKAVNNTNLCIQQLANKALGIHKNRKVSERYMEFTSRILRTRIMKWSKIVSDIATELAISMKQHCKKDEFIIKKLKDFSCFLLIKSTKSSSHIFFSILVMKKDVEFIKNTGKVFRNFMQNPECYWTEFVSLNEAKIVNWSLTESRSMSMIPYWLEFFEVPPFMLSLDDVNPEEPHIKEKIKEAYKMTVFTTMVALADKPEIEEHLTNIRHMTMEAFASYPNYPRPFKMFSKFANQFRSRLTVFIVKKLLSFNDYIVNGNIKSYETEGGAEDLYTMTGSVRNWSGLINPITRFPLNNPGQVINLMYLGYIKNKNEKNELHSDSSVLMKILSLEEKFTPEIKERIGKVNKEFGSETAHEYNIDLIKYSCDHALEKKLFSKEQAGKELMALISTTNVEDILMTFKASSNFDESFTIFSVYSAAEIEKRRARAKNGDKDTPENYMKSSYYKRSKVIEKSIKYVEGNRVKLIDILPLCFQEIMSNGHLRICVFKKQQHGGLREIFVLNFAERVVQYVIEQAGRLLCSYYPGETMTHPDSKKKIPEQHASQSKRVNKHGITITTFSSSDASKWSQNHYSHKFAIMFVRLFPKEWHGFLWNSLSLWRNKRIKISDALLNHFSKGMGLKFYDEKIQDLYEGFKGIKKSKWIKPDHSYIEVETGMMQGILHYTSSAFHTLMNSLVEKEVRRYCKTIKIPFNCIISTMQSSDDSGMILTLNNKELPRNKSTYTLMLKLMYTLHEFKNVLNSEVSIINSIKSVIHCSRVFEFNSKFYFANFHYEPEIKLLFAAQIISERESLLERQEELSTLLSTFVETGGSFYSAFFVQFGQLISCYRALGSSVSVKFQILFTCLLMMPEPSIGFFLMDNPIGPGLSGFVYNVWKNSRETRVSAAYRMHLDKVLSRKENSKLETTNLGLLVRQSFLQFGARYKLEQLKRRINCPVDWVKQIDENPVLLFREAQSTSEYMLKVAMRLGNRGVSESMSTGVSTTSIMASSAYILNCAVFSILDDDSIKTQEVTFKGEKRKKATLLSMIENCMVARGDCLTEEQERILFPFLNEYLNLQTKLESVDDLVFVKRAQEKRRVITSVEVLEKDQGPLISTLSVLKMKWFESEFQNKTPYSKRIMERVFLMLKENISWLSDSFSETLKQSPFDHAHQMMNWFIRLQTKSRVMCLLGAPISTQRGRSTINSALNMNFHKSHVLHRNYQFHGTLSALGNLLHQIIGISSFPQSADKRTELITRLLLENKESIVFDASKSLSRTNSVATIIELIKQNPDIPKAIQQIEQNKRGYCGSWIVRQHLKFDKTGNRRYTGKGAWSGIISGVRTRIEVGDNESRGLVTRAFVLDWKPYYIDDFIKGLKAWMKDNHLNAPEVSFTAVRESELVMYFNNGYNMAKLGFPVIKAPSTIPFDINIDESTRFAVDTEDWVGFLKKDVAALRLYAIDEDDHRTTMISVPLYPSDWNITSPPSYSEDHKNYALTDWVSNRAMSLSKCIKNISKQKRNRREDLLMLIRKIIIKRLNTIGVVTDHHNPPELISSSHIAQQDAEDVVSVSSFGDEMDLEDALDFEWEAFGESANEEDIIDMMGTDDSLSCLLETDFDLDVFVESRQLMGDRIINGSSLFNNLVESWRDHHTVGRLNRILKTGYYLAGEQDLIQNYFSWLFPAINFCMQQPDYCIQDLDDLDYDPFDT